MGCYLIKNIERDGKKSCNGIRKMELFHATPGSTDDKVLVISEDKPQILEDGSTRGAISIREIDELIKEVFGI